MSRQPRLCSAGRAEGRGGRRGRWLVERALGSPVFSGTWAFPGRGAVAGTISLAGWYDQRPLTRYLLFAVPLLVLTLGLFTFALEALGLQTAPALRATDALPPLFVLGTWLLEAVGLTALFLILEGRTSSRWLEGLLTGWISWVFRGPLLVLTVVPLTRQPPDLWWALALRWLAVYTLCGLLLALLAHRLGLDPET